MIDNNTLTFMILFVFIGIGCIFMKSLGKDYSNIKEQNNREIKK